MMKGNSLGDVTEILERRQTREGRKQRDQSLYIDRGGVRIVGIVGGRERVSGLPGRINWQHIHTLTGTSTQISLQASAHWSCPLIMPCPYNSITTASRAACFGGYLRPLKLVLQNCHRHWSSSSFLSSTPTPSRSFSGSSESPVFGSKCQSLTNLGRIKRSVLTFGCKLHTRIILTWDQSWIYNLNGDVIKATFGK